MNITEIMLKLGLSEPNGVSKEDIEKYQQKLFDAKRALIPLGYSRFLQQSNGVQTDTLSLFGIADGKNDVFCRDIFDANTITGTTDGSDTIFLGDNFTEYLSYSWRQKRYFITDKQTLKNTKSFAFFDHAVAYFLRDYIEK